MSHAYARLHYHIVFSTKQRQTFIKSDLKDRLYGYLIGIVNNLDGVIEAIGGIDDHIHLLAFCPPKLAVADFIGKIKANSSGWVHKTWPERAAFSWQRGYGAFSVSESNVESVKTYIADQEVHHRKMTFQEEFRMLLIKHGIPFHEKDLWD
ncbi:MAG: IS200/IS605 family transposase [Pirellulaceae bacterium]